jgi:ankyrin repeat protein
MLAAEDDNIEIVKLLLEAGADPALKDDDGDTAEDLADSPVIKELFRRFRKSSKQD